MGFGVYTLKKLLLAIWNAVVNTYLKLADAWWRLFDFFYRHLTHPPKVADVEETIQTILDNNSSIARFGDGEIKLVAGRDISFQKATDLAVSKLRQTLASDEDNLLICLADIFGDRSRYNESGNRYWKKHLARFRRYWYKYLHKGKQYYNASITRQYISLKDRSQSACVFEKFKMMWDDRDIVFIEGEKSRMGVGNDLFANARSIRRILGPAKEAFSRYDDILQAAATMDKDVLFLLALGPCATALARDLHLMGYQALDIGHIDVEYEWHQMGAEKKVPLKNKMVFEANGIPVEDEQLDPIYLSQIIACLT